MGGAVSNYWYDVYGKRSRDFIDGVKAGVTTFAIWRNGRQFVGAMGTPLNDVLDSIEKGLGSTNGDRVAGTEES